MKEEKLVSNKILVYTILKRFINSAITFSFAVLIMIALLSMGQLVFGNAAESPMLIGTLDASVWIKDFTMPILVLSAIYSLFTGPVQLLARRLVIDDEGISILDGFLFKKKNFIPYGSIENVEMEQTPVQELLHFSDLTVNHDGWSEEIVETLPEKQAKRMLQSIATRARRSAHTQN